MNGGFVKVALGIASAPRVLLLARRMQRDETWAVGAIVRLDTWLATQDSDGDLQALRPHLPSVVGWTSRKGREVLADALVETLGDANGMYRDWLDRWAPVKERREKDAARQRRHRQLETGDTEPFPGETAAASDRAVPEAVAARAMVSPPPVTPSAPVATSATNLSGSATKSAGERVTITRHGVEHSLPADAHDAIKDPTSVAPDTPEKALLGYAWEAWRLYVGEVDFGRFRKAAAPMLSRYGFASMLGAMQVWRAHRRAVGREEGADRLRFLGINAFLEQAEHLVRLSKMDVEDAKGVPTERGTFTSHYTARPTGGRRAS